MKRILLGLLLVGLINSCSCDGSDSNSSSTSSRPPGISTLKYFPVSVPLGFDGGETAITGSIDFIDADGDVTAIGIRHTDGSETVSRIAGMKVVTSGTTGINVIGSTNTKGVFYFQVWVVDALGNKSNELTGTFLVM